MPAEQSSKRAPTNAISRLMETEKPKRSPPPASEGVSFCSSTQSVPLKRNTYTDPQLMPLAQSSFRAPTTSVSPLTETEAPNSSPAAASEAISFCSSTQLVPSNRIT